MLLSLGAARRDRIDRGGDKDQFKIVLKKGESYIFEIEGLTGLDPTLALFGPDGRRIKFNNDVDDRFDILIVIGPHWVVWGEC